MSTNPAFNDSVEYTLQHNDYGSLIITEPVGWTTDEKELARHKNYHGILTKFTGGLKFVGDGADYITTIYELYGVNELISLKRRERHPTTNLWVTSYIGVIDMSTYELQNGQVTIKFNNSDLEQLLKSRESKKIQIERTDDMDGNTIDDLETKQVRYDGSGILLKSSWTVDEINNAAKVSVESNAGNTRGDTVGLPFKLEANGHLGIAQSVTPETDGGEDGGNLGMMVMHDNDRDRILDIRLLNCKTDIFVQQYESIQWAFYRIGLTIYENGSNYDVKERIYLYRLEDENQLFGGSSFLVPSQFWQYGAEFEYVNPNFQLLAGESLAVEAFLKADMSFDNNAGSRVYARNIEGDLYIDEKSYFEPTTGKMIMSLELGERLTEVMTGRKDAFHSKALGRTDRGYAEDGKASLTGYTHGHWIRGFDRLPLNDEENKYKAFTTSFKDYALNESVINNLGIGIEKFGFKERIRMEPLEYFYNNNVLIRLGKEVDGVFVYPRVKKLKRKAAIEYFFDKVEIGAQKGWQNEEAQGLDEANTRSEYSTAITRVTKTFQKITRYVLGRYPQEFIRRKPKTLFSTYDHKYDKDIFPLDLKRGTDQITYLERKWQDDFAEAPTGIFSVDTANKLRYSGVNLLLKHGAFIATCLTKYIDKYIMFGGSEGNSQLVTKLIGGQRLKEDGTGETSKIIQNIDLNRARYIPEWLEFEFPADFLIMEQVEGITNILGEDIPNFYGLVQFRNEKGILEKGFLFNLKPTGAGKWKLLKANR